jgi:thymidylate kinase
MDRAPLCVLIYSKGLNLKEKDYKLILDMYNSVKWREDYIIYLIANPDTILKRIAQRGSLEKFRKRWNEEEKDYLLKILSNYNQFLASNLDKEKLFTVDTNNLSPEEVLEKLFSIIRKLTGYSFKKLEKPPAAQKNLINFLK